MQTKLVHHLYPKRLEETLPGRVRNADILLILIDIDGDDNEGGMWTGVVFRCLSCSRRTMDFIKAFDKPNQNWTKQDRESLDGTGIDPSLENY